MYTIPQTHDIHTPPHTLTLHPCLTSACPQLHHHTPHPTAHHHTSTPPHIPHPTAHHHTSTPPHTPHPCQQKPTYTLTHHHTSTPPHTPHPRQQKPTYTLTHLHTYSFTCPHHHTHHTHMHYAHRDTHITISPKFHLSIPPLLTGWLTPHSCRFNIIDFAWPFISLYILNKCTNV